MSTKSSFREALGRRDATKEKSRGRSAFPAVTVILVRDDIRQPVDFVRLLTRRGLSLRKAHDALSKLAAGESVELEFRTNKRDQLRSELSQAGVRVRFVHPADQSPGKARARFGF